MDIDYLERILDGSEEPRNLDLSVLKRITENFSEKREIGSGAYGVVYKGILPGGQVVAVKKLAGGDTDEKMFQQEVRTMLTAKHKNIVRLIGFCSHTESRALKIQQKYILAEERVRLLCYELMVNGSLDYYVHDDELEGLDWNMCFGIIKGICEGLYYLHKDAHILHMDLKPSNILLDRDMVPKLTDFGRSRIYDMSENLSSLVYCAPEYMEQGKVSSKSDIYSLGTIIREMVTGSRKQPIIDIVQTRWKQRWKEEAKSITLAYQRQMTRCLELALRCSSKDPTERPDIVDIIQELNEMDRTFMDIGDSSKTRVEQGKANFEDMLGKATLEFRLSAKLKQISHSVQLTNDTDDYAAFKIEEKNIAFGQSDTGRLPFCMHTNKDAVPPKSSRSVTVTLEALKKPLQEHCVLRSPLLHCCCERNPSSLSGLRMDDDLYREYMNLERVLEGSKRPGKLTLSILSHMTASFSDERKIGNGGCGDVYKGILPSGQIVAVKKLFNNRRNERIFEQEVRAMKMVKHQNVVRFLGYCSHTEGRTWKMQGRYVLADEPKRLLCFEYISKGSLEDYVTDELRGLDWDARFQIIRGICEGLHLIHKKGIIHMDIKPPNILLSEKMMAKIADFGISRLGEIATKTMSQTRIYSQGYCAPEYLDYGIMSFESDIYSLGVIIIEMVTGTRKDPDISTVKRRWRHRWKKSAKHMALAYEREVSKCFELEQKCNTTLKPKERPNMQDIIKELNEMDNMDIHNSDATQSTVEQVKRSWRDSWKKYAKDMTVGYEQMPKCLELAKLCKNQNPKERPKIHKIISALNEMDKTGSRHSDATKFMVEQHPQKNTFLEDMLEIEPLELHFTAELNKENSHSIQLTNDTDDYIAFRISLEEKNMAYGVSSATGQLPFCVDPKKDIVPPRSSCTVRITLHALKKTLQEHWVAELSVRSIRVDKGLIAKDITAAMFKEAQHKVVDWVNLTVTVRAPKQQLLVVEPLELRYYWPDEPNLPCSLQLTNSTDDYVAFMFKLPQEGKVLYHQAMGMGIMPPQSTRGVVIDMLVEAAALADMKRKDTCVIRSVVVDKKADFRDEDVGMDMFYEQTGVQEVELDIVFAIPSSIHPTVYGDENDSEDDEAEYMGDSGALISPFSIETELLHIYPAEVRFLPNEDAEPISLINNTDDDVTYFIAHCDDERYIDDDDYRGIVPPQSTRAVRVFSQDKPSGLRIMMLSGSGDYGADHLYNSYSNDKREKLMNQVRVQGQKAHEALLSCVTLAPHAESVATTDKMHEVILGMDENGLTSLTSMDVHPTEPWVVTGHHGGDICIWKMDPKSGACETMKSTHISMASSIESVKFIARMQWVACGDRNGYITVYTYTDDRLREIKKFQADEKGYDVCALAVHPALPYLLSSSRVNNLIRLWDWDQGWMCTKNFQCSSTFNSDTCKMTFNPKDANSFASLDNAGEINIWNIESEGKPHTTWFCGHTQTVDIAYCNTRSGSNRMATVSLKKGKIEILDLRSKITHVHALEATGLLDNSGTWFIACHPTRPLLATANANTGVLLWNYTTHRFRKVVTFNNSGHLKINGLGFIDTDGFQRLVIAHDDNIRMVDSLDGPALTNHPW